VSGGLTRRTVLAGGVLALLVGGAFAVLLGSLAGLREADRRAMRSAEVLVAAGALEHTVITGDAAALSRRAAALERLVADQPEQRARAESIRAVGDRSAAGADLAAADLAAADLAALTAADLAALTAAEHALVADARRDADAAGRRVMLAGVGGLIGSVALIVLFTGYLSRTVVRPVRRATTMAGRLADGDLAARVPERGADEVGALAHSLNTMAGALGENREQLAASRSRIVAAADRERRRIERDLHDGTQQRLVSLMLDLRDAATAADNATAPDNATTPDNPAAADDAARLRARLDRVVEGLAATLDELRETSRGIHPAVLSEGGLPPALRALARRSAVPVELTVELSCRLPERVEVAAYYVVSEALANAAKHARASATQVGARTVDGSLLLCVRDDGVGGARVGAGSGLTGLADRVAALGGRIAVTSRPGQGTAVEVDLPVS
jgi:signal transduction histidine kinase